MQQHHSKEPKNSSAVCHQSVSVGSSTIGPSVHSFVYPLSHCLPACLSVCKSGCLSVYVSVSLSVCLSVHPSVRPFIHLSHDSAKCLSACSSAGLLLVVCSVSSSLRVLVSKLVEEIFFHSAQESQATTGIPHCVSQPCSAATSVSSQESSDSWKNTDLTKKKQITTYIPYPLAILCIKSNNIWSSYRT